MSLSAHEEEVLRRVARDNSPMRPVNPATSAAGPQNNQMSYGQFLGALIEREAAKGPMKVVAGPDSDGEWARARAPKGEPAPLDGETATYAKDEPEFV
jgi:hypothetical protein